LAPNLADKQVEEIKRIADLMACIRLTRSQKWNFAQGLVRVG
jgi:hypothetical protein